jgi:hypothetical protein
MSSCHIRAIALATLFVSFCCITVTTARADMIQIPAIAFAQRASSVQAGVAQGGTMTTAQGKYYAAVPFPFSSDGNVVCKFTLIHRDNDVDSEINARLYKKRIILGDTPFTFNVLMARVRTGVAAGNMGVAAVSDTSINVNKLTLDRAFYYVELEFGSTLLEALGVQIEYAPVC